MCSSARPTSSIDRAGSTSADGPRHAEQARDPRQRHLAPLGDGATPAAPADRRWRPRRRSGRGEAEAIEHGDADEEVTGRLVQPFVVGRLEAHGDRRLELAAPRQRQPPHQSAESGRTVHSVVVDRLHLGGPAPQLFGLGGPARGDDQRGQHGLAIGRRVAALEQWSHQVGEVVSAEQGEVGRRPTEPRGELARGRGAPRPSRPRASCRARARAGSSSVRRPPSTGRHPGGRRPRPPSAPSPCSPPPARRRHRAARRRRRASCRASGSAPRRGAERRAIVVEHALGARATRCGSGSSADRVRAGRRCGERRRARSPRGTRPSSGTGVARRRSSTGTTTRSPRPGWRGGVRGRGDDASPSTSRCRRRSPRRSHRCRAWPNEPRRARSRAAGRRAARTAARPPRGDVVEVGAGGRRALAEQLHRIGRRPQRPHGDHVLAVDPERLTAGGQHGSCGQRPTSASTTAAAPSMTCSQLSITRSAGLCRVRRPRRHPGRGRSWRRARRRSRRRRRRRPTAPPAGRTRRRRTRPD